MNGTIGKGPRYSAAEYVRYFRQMAAAKLPVTINMVITASQIVLRRIQPRHPLELKKAPLTLKPGGWIPVFIRQDANKLTVYVNGQSVLEAEDEHRPHERQDLALREGVVGHVLVQVHALDEFHGVVVHALVQATLVHAGDMGVLEACGEFDFPLEAEVGLRRGEPCGAEHLEGNRAARAELYGPPDDAHAAFAQRPEDLVPLDLGQGPLGAASVIRPGTAKGRQLAAVVRIGSAAQAGLHQARGAQTPGGVGRQFCSALRTLTGPIPVNYRVATGDQGQLFQTLGASPSELAWGKPSPYHRPGAANPPLPQI